MPLKLTKKGQGHLKVRVKVTLYQDQTKGKSIFCLFANVFCDLYITQMVCLRLKGILVYISFGKQFFYKQLFVVIERIDLKMLEF